MSDQIPVILEADELYATEGILQELESFLKPPVDPEHLWDSLRYYFLPGLTPPAFPVRILNIYVEDLVQENLKYFTGQDFFYQEEVRSKLSCIVCFNYSCKCL